MSVTRASLSGLHDVELAAFAAAGGRQEFGELVRRHSASVRGLLRRMGAEAALADDVAAVEGVARAVWSGLGQLPTAFGRVLVAEAVAEALTARLARRLATLRLGDPLDGTTDLGPLRSADALEALQSALEAAVAAGAALSNALVPDPSAV